METPPPLGPAGLGLEFCSPRGVNLLGPVDPLPAGLLDVGLLGASLLEVPTHHGQISYDCQTSSPFSADRLFVDCLAASGEGSVLQSRGDNLAGPRASVVPRLPSSPPPEVH
jgi:hypothetical protein